MLTVALTGGIATGKSVVAGILARHGCAVRSADKAAHDLMKPGRPAWRQIVDHFGPKILNADGRINRARLGSIVFARSRERQFLNRVVHPLVLEKQRRTVRRLAKKGLHRIFIWEAALTIESGFAPFFDRIIVVDCAKEVQIKRLMERDGISRAEAGRKILSQMPGAEKRKEADYIIDTSGSLQKTAAQTEKVFRRLLRDWRTKQKRAEVN